MPRVCQVLEPLSRLVCVWYTATEKVVVVIVRKEANYRCPYVECQYTYI